MNERLRHPERRVKTIECRLDASKALKDMSEQIEANVNDYSAEQRQEMAKIIREVVECGR